MGQRKSLLFTEIPRSHLAGGLRGIKQLRSAAKSKTSQEIIKHDTSILRRSKIYAHPKRLYEWLTTGKTRPITLEMDPTNNCTNQCKACAGNRSSKHAELTYQNMLRIINEVSWFIKGIVFSGGGEPLLNPWTVDSIRYAKKRGMEIGLVTNGLPLCTNSIERLVKDCTWIRVSLDAPDERQYVIRKGTDGKNYQIVWKNVYQLISTRNAAKTNCTIGVAYLTNDSDDLGTLELFSKQARQAGADYVEFRPYHQSNNNLIPLLEKIKYLETDTFKIIYPREKYEKKKFSYKRAFADEFRFVVTATGEVYPDCFTRGIQAFSYGNILEQTFKEIWSSQKREEVLRTKLQHKNCPEQCFYDPLNQLLWLMHVSISAREHVNFI
jgi:radical SAM protein with 4Fe4S-binding SPASM domain